MSKTQGGSDKPPVARADELLNNLGRRIGFFAGLAGQRIQSTAVNMREQTRRMNQHEAAAGEKSSQPPRAQTEESAQPETEKATAKAEELVEGMAQRLGLFAALAGLQIQKTAARVREEAEDLWAEAQNIRNEQNTHNKEEDHGNQ
jgi:hypothetical protein